MRRGGGLTWRGRRFRIGLESATILLRFHFKMATIFASRRPTIGPRTGHDRGPSQSSIVLRLTGGDCVT